MDRRWFRRRTSLAKTWNCASRCALYAAISASASDFACFSLANFCCLASAITSEASCSAWSSFWMPCEVQRAALRSDAVRVGLWRAAARLELSRPCSPSFALPASRRDAGQAPGHFSVLRPRGLSRALPSSISRCGMLPYREEDVANLPTAKAHRRQPRELRASFLRCFCFRALRVPWEGG
jgi:hypothetical protein